MKKLLYILSISLIFFSCERRELTYNFSPYCDVVVNVDWSNMTKSPNGMSVRCYPESGAKPIVVETNSVDQAVLQLPAGIYNIIVFNQIPSDFGTVAFRGLDKFETTEVYAAAPITSSWASSKGNETLVREPEEIAASTFLDVEVKQECIENSTALYKAEGRRLVAATVDLEPVVIVTQAKVKVKVQGIHNLRSTRATFTGMAEGYNFAEQRTLSSHVTHTLDNWVIEPFSYGDLYGVTSCTFSCFGIPNTDISTRTKNGENQTKAISRAIDDWDASIYLQMLLVDNKTIIEHEAKVEKYTTQDEFGTTISTTINVEVGGSGDVDDPEVVLPDVKPEGSTDSGFSADVEEWGDEENVDMPL